MKREKLSLKALVLDDSSIIINGDRIMMTITGATGVDHAVIVTGAFTDEKGDRRVSYYDPTTGLSSSRLSGDYTTLYGVGQVGSHGSNNSNGSYGSCP